MTDSKLILPTISWGGVSEADGGVLFTIKNPSTALRAVPLPCKCRGG